MHLSQVQLTNYRAFSTAVLTLPPAGVVLITGANNSGKSALLSALDATLRGISYPNMGYAGTTEPQVTLRFSLEEDERAVFVEFARLQRAVDLGSDTFSWVDLTFSFNGANMILTSVAVQWANNNPLIVAHHDVVANQIQASPLVFPNIAGDPTVLQPVQGGSQIEGSSFQATEPSLQLLKGLQPLRAGYYHFEPLRPGAQAQTQFNAVEQLDPQGTVLPGVLRYLSDNNPATYRLIAATLTQLVPELGILGFRSGGQIQEIVFDDPANLALRQNLQDLGTGVEQLLLTLVLGIAQPQARTVIIEEPETALEAGAQRSLLALLQQWSEDRLFIVSTHSTAMMDWSAPSSGRLFHVRRVNGRSRITRVRENFRQLLDDLDVRLSDVMSAETILIVEGSSDRDILGGFFPQLLQDPRIAVIPGGGADQARLAHIFDDWLSQADKLGNRQIRFLRDRDELTPELLSSLEKQRLVIVLPCREIENYLLNATAIRSAMARESDEIPDATELETAIREAADKLVDVTILGLVIQRLPAFGLKRNELRSSLANFQNKLDSLLNRVLGSLPGRDELEQEIRGLWASSTNEVQERWNSDWRILAPGSRVLNALYQQFLNRQYRKTSDGPTIARTFEDPPRELADLLRPLIPMRFSHQGRSGHPGRDVDGQPDTRT